MFIDIGFAYLVPRIESLAYVPDLDSAILSEQLSTAPEIDQLLPVPCT